jgi:hypothetical protein
VPAGCGGVWTPTEVPSAERVRISADWPPNVRLVSLSRCWPVTVTTSPPGVPPLARLRPPSTGGAT